MWNPCLHSVICLSSRYGTHSCADVGHYVPFWQAKDVSIGIGKELLLLKWLARQTHFDTVAIQNTVVIFFLPCCFQLYFIFKKQKRLIYACLICSFQVIQISSFLLCGCLVFLALLFSFLSLRGYDNMSHIVFINITCFLDMACSFCQTEHMEETFLVSSALVLVMPISGTGKMPSYSDLTFIE